MRLREIVKVGDNIFWIVPRKSTAFWRFIFAGIRFFSKSKSYHVAKVLGPGKYASMETPKPKTLDDDDVGLGGAVIMVRRPVAQSLITIEAVEKMKILWSGLLRRGEYDEAQIIGIMLAKILGAKKPVIEESRSANRSVCSATCSYLDCEGLNFDPVPLTPDALTDPGMLERSRAYETVGTYNIDIEGVIV